MAVPLDPIRVRTNAYFSRVSRQSRLSANDKGDNKHEARGCAQISWHLLLIVFLINKVNTRRSVPSTRFHLCHLPTEVIDMTIGQVAFVYESAKEMVAPTHQHKASMAAAQGSIDHWFVSLY